MSSIFQLASLALQETAICHFLVRNPRISTKNTGTHVSACLSTRAGVFRALGPSPSHNRPTACILGIILPTTGSTEVVTTNPYAPSQQHSLYNDAGTFHIPVENTYSIHRSVWELMDYRAGLPSYHFSSSLFPLVSLVNFPSFFRYGSKLIDLFNYSL